MVLTTHALDRRLDLLAGVGQRSATFRFDLVDGVTSEKLGELHPHRSSPPTLSHDTSRTIKRTLSPLNLDRADTAEINPVRDRIEVAMIVGGREWPLGRYVFTDHAQVVSTAGRTSTATLVDEMFIVDQKLDVGFSTQTTILSDAVLSEEGPDQMLRRLLRSFTFELRTQPSQYQPIGSWPIGTNRGQIIEDIALGGDYFSPWFDHTGVIRFIRSFDPATRVAAFDWDARDVVMRDSIVEVSDLLTAPNRIVVVSNGQTGVGDLAVSQPIVGSYDLPRSAPQSQANRGFVITETFALPVSTTTQATAVATNIGQRTNVTERVELSTAPDPRHDSYDVVRWEGANWLEIGWSLPLVEGGEMRHVLRKAHS